MKNLGQILSGQGFWPLKKCILKQSNIASKSELTHNPDRYDLDCGSQDGKAI